MVVESWIRLLMVYLQLKYGEKGKSRNFSEPQSFSSGLLFFFLLLLSLAYAGLLRADLQWKDCFNWIFEDKIFLFHPGAYIMCMYSF